MSDGFMAFKGLGWAAAALVVVATVMPGTSWSQLNRLRTTEDRLRTGQNEMTRPGLLKKASYPTTTTTTTTTNTTTFVYPQETTIPSEFAPSTSIFASYMPNPQPAGESVGAFRFMCGSGQLSYDDPIVYPGQPHKAHLHQFYGNLGANAYSTFQSLRTSGYSTCSSPTANAANRSAYWMPAMLDGKGNVVQPDTVDRYYKRDPKTSATCQPGNKYGITACATIPNGMRFIFGYDMQAGVPSNLPFYFYCDAVGGQSTTMGPALANCPVGAHLYVRADAPSCWDGAHLDSADHRSHLSYMVDTHLGYFACPSTHPIAIPALTLSVAYRIAAGDTPSAWRFSSDLMHPELPAGSTMHADYFEAWDPTVKAMWTDNCIDKRLNCNGGALGNGYSIIGAANPAYGWINPNHLVPMPQ
jgi:Domain of unknown function (DUF1996)